LIAFIEICEKEKNGRAKPRRKIERKIKIRKQLRKDWKSQTQKKVSEED
jgi:hypothetical protein